MREVIIITLLAVHLLLGCPAWLSDGNCCEAVRALAYPLFHANVWHLAANALAVWTVFAPRKGNAMLLTVAALISLAVYPLSPRPMVGISNLIYAAVGLRTPPIRSPWWRAPQVLVFIAVTVLMLALPQFSAVTHIAAFAAGCVLAAAGRFRSKLKGDARRYL